ncbi:MAG: hypothetical protein RR778_15780 [Glutamicibacter sp.]|uniref:hypothetical protein n=1 Tax=Glutamicibacter sp. TaxID=1931995 RepID=UPI002FC90A82
MSETTKAKLCPCGATDVGSCPGMCGPENSAPAEPVGEVQDAARAQFEAWAKNHLPLHRDR